MSSPSTPPDRAAKRRRTDSEGAAPHEVTLTLVVQEARCSRCRSILTETEPPPMGSPPPPPHLSCLTECSVMGCRKAEKWACHGCRRLCQDHFEEGFRSTKNVLESWERAAELPGLEEGAPVVIRVNGLEGTRCMVDASTMCTIEKVKREIYKRLGVSVHRQLLCMGTEKVTKGEVQVGQLINSPAFSLEFHQEDPLLKIMRSGDEAKALALFHSQQSPNLNKQDEQGCTLLHRAVMWGLPNMALTLLSLPAFTAVNKVDSYGRTALHLAITPTPQAEDVCRALLHRADFTELGARERAFQRTAPELARTLGFAELAKMFESHRGHVPENTS